MELVGKLFSAKIESKQRAIEEIVQNTATFSQNFINEPQKITQLIREVVANNSGDVFGMSLAYNPKKQNKSPYFYWNEAILSYKDLASVKNYQYQNQEWFKTTFTSKKATWSSFYKDNNGGEALMTTYAYPILDAQKNIQYILTGDLSLAWLNEELNQLSFGKYQHLIYLTTKADGKIIAQAHLDKFNFDAKNLESKKVVYNKLMEIKGAEEDFFALTIPLNQYNWDVTIIFSASEVRQALNQSSWMVALFSLIGIFLIVSAIYFISKTITKPIKALSHTIKNIGEGDLENFIPYQNNKDEIGMLARSFTQLQSDLKLYIDKIKTAEASKQRIESELLIGHKIQQSLLPNLSSHNFDSFEIEGFLKSAREVGGDLYDFFLINPKEMFLVIGDVSGKGVPAALQMAGIRAFIRAKAQENQAPHQILYSLNNELCQNNPLCMFATIYCVILNLETGALTASNAGHDYPFIVQGQNNIRQLKNNPKPAVGIIEAVEYECISYQLQKNEQFFLYTDGVTDAQNQKEEAFSAEKLEQLLKSPLSINDKLKLIDQKLNEFSEGVDQFDDITLLAVQYK